MAASLSGEFNFNGFTSAGALAASYRLYTYTAGTTTKKTAYTDSAASVAHTYTSDGAGGEYIALNARGELPAPLFLTSGPYDITLKTDAGVTVWTRRAKGADDDAATLEADLADTSDAAKGDAMIGIKRTLTDAVASTLHGWHEQASISAHEFGAVGNGVADDYASIVKAVKAARGLRDTLGLNAVAVRLRGMHLVTQGIPLITGVPYYADAKYSATVKCNGSTAAAYTATYSAGTITDNLDAALADVQSGAKEVNHSGAYGVYFEHTGAIAGNAPSGAAWESVVQIVGAPGIVLEHSGMDGRTNNINGFSLKYSWRCRLYDVTASRNGGFSGGIGIFLDSNCNSANVISCFAFGAWAVGIQSTNPDSVTIIEPNVEFATIGLWVGGKNPRIIGGYYEGNGTDIQLGTIGGAGATDYILESSWHNGSSSNYGIYLANCRGVVRHPSFTGTYAVSEWRSATEANGNAGNHIHMSVSDANAPGLSAKGLSDGRNIVFAYGIDNDDHRQYVIWSTNGGGTQQVEQQLNQRGAKFNCFELWAQNDGGTLKVAITDGDEAATTYDDCFAALSSTLIAQADVSAGAAFGANVPASRLSGTNSILILNTGDNVTGEQAFVAGAVRTNNGTALSVEVRLRSRDIGGTTRVRPEVRLRNAATDAAFDFDTTNFTAGEYVKVPIIGFIK